jgi:hypothetical protein
MSDDLVEQLRAWPATDGKWDALEMEKVSEFMCKAADEIEALRHDIDRHLAIASRLLDEIDKLRD